MEAQQPSSSIILPPPPSSQSVPPVLSTFSDSDRVPVPAYVAPSYPPIYHWDKSKYLLTVRLPDDKETIPDFTGELREARVMVIIGGRNLKSLPLSLAALSRLQSLSFHNCPDLRQLPLLPNLNGLVSLKQLTLWRSGIKAVPDSITGLPNLEVLHILFCPELEALPTNLNGLISLKKLDICFCPTIKSLPESITTLPNLEYLNLNGCNSLKQLPANLNKLPKLKIEFPFEGEELADYIAVPHPPIALIYRDMTPPDNHILNKTLDKECGKPTHVTIPDGWDQDLAPVNTTTDFDISGEGIAQYVTVPPHGPETLDEHGMALFDGQMRAPASSSENGRDVFGSKNNHHSENGNMLNNTLEEKNGKGKRPVFQGNQPQNMMLVDTTLQLGGSWLTIGPHKRRRSASEDKSHSLSSCASNSSVLKLITLASGANPEYPQESLNQHGWSGSRAQSTYLKMNKLLPNTSTIAVKETTTATPNEVCSYGSGVSPCPLVVKGTYKEEVFRLQFSCTPDFNELNEQVGKKLEPVLNKYRMKFKDMDGDWVLMKDDSDLEYCLRVFKSSDEDIVRLKVVDL